MESLGQRTEEFPFPQHFRTFFVVHVAPSRYFCVYLAAAKPYSLVERSVLVYSLPNVVTRCFMNPGSIPILVLKVILDGCGSEAAVGRRRRKALSVEEALTHVEGARIG